MPEVPGGEMNADLLYNQGLEYRLKNDTGNSVASFKRALALRPGDKEARAALDNERRSLGLPGVFFERTPIEMFLLFPFTVFPLNAAAVIGIISLVLGSLGLCLYLLELPQMPPFFRKRLEIPSIALALFGIIYIAAALVRFNAAFDSKEAVVVITGEMKDRPAPDALPIEKVSAGMECRVRRESAEHTLILTVTGREGWISTSNLTRLWKASDK